MSRGAGPYVSTGAARYSLASILPAAPPSLARKRYIVVVSFVRIPHPPFSLSLRMINPHPRGVNRDAMEQQSG